MLPRATLLLALFPALLLSGCPQSTTKLEHQHVEGEPCSHEDESTKIEHPQVARTTEGETPVLLAGAKLGEATAATEVTVEVLLASPEKYAGMLVRVSGDVSSYCHHKRSWFSLVAGDKSGGNVRVLTTPSFLVPEGVIGMNASTEGVVELIEVPEAEARHFAKEHKLGDPEAIVGPQKRAVVRAVGAAFRRA